MALSLTACSPAAETPVVAESPIAETAVTPTSRRDGCKDVAAFADLDSCLPSNWSSRDGSQPVPAATGVMI
jgi:hypothetical protein